MLARGDLRSTEVAVGPGGVGAPVEADSLCWRVPQSEQNAPAERCVSHIRQHTDVVLLRRRGLRNKRLPLGRSSPVLGVVRSAGIASHLRTAQGLRGGRMNTGRTGGRGQGPRLLLTDTRRMGGEPAPCAPSICRLVLV